MPAVKITFDDFITPMDKASVPYALELNEYLLANGCKATFEEKKTGLLGSYKHTKSKKVIGNFLLRKQGFLVRIYAEHMAGYRDFLETMPADLLQTLGDAPVCRRLVHNTCSPKCSGYDFTIGEQHFQKCRYACFEFVVTADNFDYLRAFVEREAVARNA